MNFADVVDSLPDVQEHAINAEQSANPKPSTDPAGQTFDPDKHASNADGSPRYTANGTFAKKRGRKGGASVKSSLGTASASSTQNSGHQLGVQVAGLIFTAGQMFGGDEWAPKQDPESGTGEFEIMASTWGKYLEAKNMTDIPPGVLVAFVMLSYIGPRLFMPKTKNKIGKIKEWFALKIYRRRNQKQPDDKE